MPRALRGSSPSPNVPKTQSEQAEIGNLGVHLVQGRVLQMKFIWREKPKDDMGLDAEIELRAAATREALGQLIGVQVKTTLRRFPGETDTAFYFPLRDDDLAYWLGSNLPVILVVARPGADGGEAYWMDVKRYFADMDIPPNPRIWFDKDRDRFDAGAAAALHGVVSAASQVPPPRNLARVRARASGGSPFRDDLGWPGYLAASRWLFRRAAFRVMAGEKVERYRSTALLEQMRCMDEIDRARIRQPVLENERFLAGYAVGETTRALSVRTLAALCTGTAGFWAGPAAARLVLGDPVPGRARLSIGLAIAGVLICALGIPVVWHRVRRVRFPRWLNVFAMLSAMLMLATGQMMVSGVARTGPGGMALRTAVAAVYVLLLAAIGYTYLWPVIDRLAESRRADAERRRPVAGVTHRLLTVLGMIDHGQSPWTGTATRRTLLKLLGETARLLERDVYRRLRPGTLRDNREWKRRCRGMAAHVRRLSAQAAAPGGTTQEGLQQEVLDVLVPIATGEWNNVPTEPPTPSLRARAWRLLRRVLSNRPRTFAPGEATPG
jgi:hypothetical protein